MGDSWVGCDLDGTLAVHEHNFNIDRIGPPVPLMVALVKAHLAEGHEVRIMTARVGGTGHFVEASQRFDDDEFVKKQRKLIEDWCVRHIGQKLPVTASKDFGMAILYDDRCRQVERNTGRLIGG